MPKINLNQSETTKEISSIQSSVNEFIPSPDESKREAITDLKSEVEKPKRKYNKSGAYKKEKSDEPKVEPLDLSLFGGVILDLVIPRLPNPIPCSAEEKKIFSESLSKIGEKYAPSLGGWDAELGFAVACLVVFSPRMRQSEQVKIDLKKISEESKVD